MTISQVHEETQADGNKNIDFEANFIHLINVEQDLEVVPGIIKTVIKSYNPKTVNEINLLMKIILTDEESIHPRPRRSSHTNLVKREMATHEFV